MGYIVGECVTGGKWWVRFTIYDENKKLNVEIAVVENDFKIINY